jgi:tRNA(Ile)-lysidine synthase
MLPPRARVLVALSGGPDSAGLLLAMATLAPELSLELRAATVNHGLRPEAVRDVAIARAQAEAAGVAITEVTLSLEPGPGAQARARQARYASLFEIARSEHCDRIAVGHTLEDQAETVLSRMLRGASIRGLRGIHPARGDGVIRPLIDVPRRDVQAAIAAKGWPVAIDPSNALHDFQRVRIREAHLPALEKESPGTVAHLAELADDAADVIELIDAMASGVLAGARIDGETALRVEPLRRAPAVVRREALAAAAEQITGVRPNRAQQLELERLLRGRGEVLLAAGAKASLDERGAIVWTPAPAGASGRAGGDKEP